MAALNYLGVVLVLLVIIGVGVASGVWAAAPQPASSRHKTENNSAIRLIKRSPLSYNKYIRKSGSVQEKGPLHTFSPENQDTLR